MTDKNQTQAAGTDHDPLGVLQVALEWCNSGKAVALATVIQTWGSSPRPAGSNLVIASDGSFAGSVSGGCVESEVIRAATDVISSGKQQILEFGVTDDEAWQVGLACGGQIRILLEPVA